jgi:hypothetical protein
MDGRRFDGLAKALAGRTSRRDALRQIAGGTAAAVLATASLTKVSAQETVPFAGTRSAQCKTCLQSCRRCFGFGCIEPPPAGACREACLAFNEAGFGGCTPEDFVG